MRQTGKGKVYLAILLSFLVAMMLMITPIGQSLKWSRPDWITLVLIYWVLVLPRHVGVLVAWTVGMVMDGLVGLTLGQYALSLTVVAMLTDLLRVRMRLFLFWQQTVIMVVLIGFGQMLLFWSQWIIGFPAQTLLYWSAVVSSVLLWPVVYFVLEVYRNKLQIV